MDRTVDPQPQPHPPVPTPRRRVLLLLIAVIAVLTVSAAAVTVAGRAGAFDPGPGEPGWHPITGSDVGGGAGSPGGVIVTQRVTNEEDRTVTVERIRSVPPRGLVEVEAGAVPTSSLKELDVFGLTTVTKPPFELRPGYRTKLYLRFRADCLPKPAAKLPLRIMLTVSMGSVRQEVEVPDVRPIVVNEEHPPAPACR